MQNESVINGAAKTITEAAKSDLPFNPILVATLIKQSLEPDSKHTEPIRVATGHPLTPPLFLEDTAQTEPSPSLDLLLAYTIETDTYNRAGFTDDSGISPADDSVTIQPPTNETGNTPPLNDSIHDQVFVNYLAPSATPNAGFDTIGVANKLAKTIKDILDNTEENPSEDLLLLNQAPVALDDAVTTDEDTPINNINVLANDSDPDGDPLTVTSAVANNGTVTINPDGTINYTPDPDFNGEDVITYEIDDGNGGTDTAIVTVTVNPVNDPPVANNDAVTTQEDTPVNNINVLVNDTDPEGDTLTVISAVAGNGTVTINPNGTLNYTPDANFNGTDIINYEISDGNGGTDTAIVTVTVTPVSDLSAADDNFTINEDTVLNASVAGNDSTTSGGTLSFVLDSLATSGNVVLNNDGSFSYTPNANYNGNDTFTYVVTDSATGESSTQTVFITVNPVPDLSAADDSFTINADTILNTTVANNDSTTSGGALNFAINAGPSNGSVTVNADGTFEYTPTPGYTGPDSFTYQVSDPASGESSIQTVNITVQPVSTLIAADDTFRINEDTVLNNTVAGNDSSSNGPLSFSLNTNVSNGTLVLNADGTFTYTPGANFNGNDSFTYDVTDGTDTSTQTVFITIDPVPDLSAANDSFTINEDTVLNNTVASNDSTTSGGALSFSLVTDVSNGSLVLNADGTFTYTPNADYNGSDTFSYQVDDPASGESSIQNVTITINPINDPPVFSNANMGLLVLEDEVEQAGTSTAAGTFTVTDVDLDTVTLTLSAPAETLSSDGTQIVWSGANTQTVIGTANGSEIIRITIDNSGNVTTILSGPIDHPIGNVRDLLDLNLTVSAFDGSTTSFGNLTVSVEDDLPAVTESLTLFSITSGNLTAAGNVLGPSGSYGADGGYVQTVKIGGYTYNYNVDSNSITQTGTSDLVSGFSYNTTTHVLTVTTLKGETLVVNMLTADYNYSTTGTATVIDPVNVAPVTAIASGSLLGLVSANALNLIDLSANQTFTASDANSNIASVVISYAPLLNIGAFTLAASQALAADLGLQIEIVNNPGLLGIIAPSSTLTITALDGGPIDNLAINELLGTVILNEAGVNVDVLTATTITVTDTDGLTATATAADLANANLLGTNTIPAEIMEGDNTANTLTGDGADNRIYGYGDDDILSGGDGNDILRGGSGNDQLDGGNGNDILIGGQGTDILTGGAGTDIFRWEEGDAGLALVQDTITDFDTASLANGGDIIDLTLLLQGEGSIGDNPGNLTNYLHFELSGVDTIVHISVNGGYQNGFAPASTDQQIVLSGVDLVTGTSDDQQIIADLLVSGKLIVDQATSTTSMLGGYTDVNFTVSDNDNDTASTTVRFDSSGQAAPPPSTNVAPDVQVNSTSLLGLAGVSVLNLIELGNQDLNAGDRDGNLQQVEVEYRALVGLGAYTLTASADLAAELGLQIQIVNDPGLLGLVNPSSTLTITAIDGGTINNLAINELLGTVEFFDGGSPIDPNLLTLDVLNSTTITATDDQGLTASDSVTLLADVNLLDSLAGNDAIQEGTAADDTLTGTAGADRLYGYDGNDTLNGLAGNDILRGGAGTDTLNGGDGNDLLIGGTGDDILTGGNGLDLFRWEEGNEGTAGTPASDTIIDFSTTDGDVLDLRDILQGETSATLDSYLNFSLVGSDTLVSLSVDGSGTITQTITLNGVDLTQGGVLTTDQQIIDSLLAGNNLLTD